MQPQSVPEYYEVLRLPRSASPAEIKQAYHRALLASHPDKRTVGSPAAASVLPDLDLLRAAYTTLSSHALRAEYDKETTVVGGAPAGPRPAQALSLEEFDEEHEGTWTHACRCGGTYRLREADMERGQHLVGCSSCSEVVWVGYELAEE